MPTPLSLNTETIHAFPKNINIPSQDRNAIKTSIAHIGVSNFHRANQAYYMHELIDKYQCLDYGICGIDLLDSDRKIYNTLKDQDGLYTLITKSPEGEEKIQIISAIVEYFFAPENPMAVIQKLAHPEITIISLTIAEDGYHLNDITGAFDLDHPAFNEATNLAFHPSTVFGYLTEAFKLRKARNLPGCTILACDNIKSNGKTIKDSFFKFVLKNAPELLPWLKQNTAFPNTMVDRITTETTKKDIDDLKSKHSIDDQWPVICESYSSWIIENNFYGTRPQWEKAGIQFVKNIAPYEEMKLHLLNSGHSVLGVFGTLYGFTTVYEAANNTAIDLFLKLFLDTATPTLEDAETITVKAYKSKLIPRLKNAYIKDNTSRICKESSAKIPLFIIPTINKLISKNKSTDTHAFFIAAWCKYYDGIDINGHSYEIRDSISNTLIRAATLSHINPTKFIEIESVFKSLIKDPIFIKSYRNYLKSIRTLGFKEALNAFIKTQKKP